jgi:antirestriction protein
MLIPASTLTFQSPNDDSFRVQVPEGWVIQDLDNTGSALLEETTRGYGILAKLCPQEEQQQEAAFPKVSGGSTTSSSISTTPAIFFLECLRIKR